MKRLVSEITIGNFQFDYVISLNIESSWGTFTDTAGLVLPNKFRDRDGQALIVGDNNVFKRGDAVEIKLGYFPNLTSKFKGFVSKLKPDSPLIMNFEDRMWLLKQENVASRSFKTATIKDVVDYAVLTLFPDQVIEYDDPTANIGGFEIDNKGFINIVEVFSVLKKNMGYHIYFIDDVLQVRALNSILALNNPLRRLSFQNNIIEDNLEYTREDDVQIVIKAESIGADNKRTILYGFKESGNVVVRSLAKKGQLRSLKAYNLTEGELEELIRRNIDNFIFEGYVGDFTTFAEPAVNHSDRIELIDLKHAEREGRYLIKKVITNFGIDGGRQIIELQNRIL